MTFTSLNTGNNSTNKNTVSSGNSTSGAAVASGLHTASLNTASISLDQTGSTCVTCSSSTGSVVTGSKSINVAAVIDVKAASITTNNFGSVNQKDTFMVNSGNNHSDGNTVGGTVNSGNATVSETVQSMLNDTTVVIKQ
jgi:hypothetical protein